MLFSLSLQLNTLFGEREISPVEQEGGTSEILDFSSNNLHFIDTPGLGSPNCLERDARTIASLKKYFDKDEELRKSIPHIVLITARFDDPKLHHVDAPFVRSLKAIHLLGSRLFSNEFCNLVVLLTRFMGERRSVRESPNPKIQIVRDLVRTHLDKSCHVIYGDNGAGDWDLPLMHWGHRLPTGDIYPGNLIDLICEIMGRSRMLLDVFQDRGRIDVSLNRSIPLVSTESKRFLYSLRSLRWAYDGNFSVSI
jgi:hypothetical protein